MSITDIPITTDTITIMLALPNDSSGCKKNEKKFRILDDVKYSALFLNIPTYYLSVCACQNVFIIHALHKIFQDDFYHPLSYLKFLSRLFIYFLKLMKAKCFINFMG